MGGRLKAGFLLAVMFALGAVSGIAWQNYRIDQQGLHQIYVTRRVKWLKRQLHLTPQQEEALTQIIGDAHERMAAIHQQVLPDLVEIHEDSVDDFRDFLTSEQRQKFDKLHEKSHARQKKQKGAAANPSPLPTEESDVNATTS